MNVLAIDGALGSFSVAIAVDGEIAAASSEAGNVALEMGVTMVRAAMQHAQLTSARLERLAVGVGPGGFTGLRIAIAYAKSFAQAWALPLVPILSFDLLEYGLELERVLTIVVGRPGIISARMRDSDRVRRASGRTADVLAAIVPQDDRPLAVVGAPKDVLAELAERAFVVSPFSPLVTPPAAAAALAAASREPAQSAHAVEADYGELPAAKVPKQFSP